MATGVTSLRPVASLYGDEMIRDTLLNDGLGSLVGPNKGDAATSGHPYVSTPVARTGAALHSFVDDYYDRIHLIPLFLNFGAVSSRQSKVFTLWSAFRSTREIETISYQDFLGVSLFDIEEGDIFRPLQYKTGQIEVNMAGPQTIEAGVTFETDQDESATLFIGGTRAGSAVFYPDWSGPITQTIEYKTTISSSINQREQRQAERDQPRVRLSYPYTAFAAGERVSESNLREFLRTRGHLPVSASVWTDFVRVTEAAPAGTDTIKVDRFPSWLQDGVIVSMFFPGTRNSVLGTVYDVDSDNAEIDVLGGFNFPVAPGMKIYRFETVRFDRPTSVTYLTNKVSRSDISLLLDPENLVYDEPEEASETLAGREVFDTREDWSESPQISYDRAGRALDYGVGVVEFKSDADFTTQTLSLFFKGLDYEKTVALRDVFIRNKGRQGEFWRPSMSEDMTPRSIPAVGDATFVLETSRIGDDYQNDSSHRAVRFYLKNGTTEDYTIESVTPDNNNDETVVELGEPWRDIGALDEITQVRWLYLYRFASDTLTIEWVTDEKTQIRMNIQTIPVEEGE